MKNKLFTNWRTTLGGVIALILLLLTNTGVIEPGQSEELTTHSVSIVDHVEAIVSAVVAIALIFSKDAD